MVKYSYALQLTSWLTNKIDEASFFQEHIISPANYGALIFIAVITMARQWYVS
jgi:hypothetical protein